MHLSGGRLVLSPTDLVGFLHCEHMAQLELQAAEGRLAAPDREDPELAVLRERGVEHEQAYLALLEGQGREVVRIADAGFGAEELVRSAAQTREAMAQGAEVVYQATFFHADTDRIAWCGHADFISRVDQPSSLGNHLYEPEDTKLARSVKPGAVLQLCNYAEHVERIQGVPPPQMYVVLGGGQDRTGIATRSVSAYYRAAKARFVEAITGVAPPTYPEPCEHCAVCRWREACEERREQDDHLSLVANLRRDQARKLRAVGIDTLAKLADSRDGTSVTGIGDATLDRLRHQARLQRRLGRPAQGPPPYEFLPLEPDRGLESLPAPSEGDLFFDIEGDPFVANGGLEYLFGVGWIEEGAFVHRAFWAHDTTAEKRALEGFVDFVEERRSKWPDLHIYHYAPYEPTALGRLMGRYATREAEIDRLLRGRVLVDLYRVVRQGLLVGTPAYSLKDLEALYMEPRAGAISGGGESVVEYERWLRGQDPTILDALAEYNRDDCESTWRLRDWLEEQRAAAATEFGREIGRPTPGKPEAPEKVAAESSEVSALVEALVPEEALGLRGAETDVRGRWLLAQLLDWHRREAKPEYWWFFRRVLDFSELDLYEDTEAVTGLEYVGPVGTEKQSTIHRYRFDPKQEHKLRKWVADPERERDKRSGADTGSSPGSLVAVNPVAGTLDLKRALYSNARHPRSLIPDSPPETPAQREALRRLARWVVDNGIDSDGPFRSARDLLLRNPPRLEAGARADLRGHDEDVVAVVSRLVSELRSGCLPIQGPPGSGKTYTGAQAIVSLVESGRRVGITANSHAVIGELLSKVMKLARTRRVSVRAVQKADDDEACGVADVRIVSTNPEAVSALGNADVIAGTPWLFARQELQNKLSHLFIDEAGQLSLANTLAVSGSAENLVLIGDPQQLAQPSKGSHPPGAERSALQHVLDGHDTIEPHRGLFIDWTRRLHPRICEFISDLAYEGRLSSLPGLEQQAVHGHDECSGSGLRWFPVMHSGNRTSSEEEASVVKQWYSALLGRTWTDHQGRTQKMDAKQILVVAPYNAQVSLLASGLPEGAQVGTVDKFQGKEAAVVFVSLAASSAEDVPRAMEFLYSRNRLNVAVSRARALAVLVASPKLLSVHCLSLEQLQLANGLCRFVDLAGRPTESS